MLKQNLKIECIQLKSKNGNENRFPFPKPLMDNTCNMSFSGLKTAVKRETEKLIANQGGLYHGDVGDICASFQKTTSEIFKYKTMNAIKFFNNNFSKFLFKII